MTFRRVYVHGAGRRGAAAWPHVAETEEVAFVSFPARSSIDEQVEHLVSRFGTERILLFAHSIGAVPVVLAARRLDLAGLVLVEPAFYDLARGDEAIERHIAIVSEARAQAADGDLRAFWAILRPLMFGGPFDPDVWDDERTVAEKWAATNLPWGHGVRPGALTGIPTLVVTGGWNAEYEQIAAQLACDGATHIVIEGVAHRAQDAPGFGSAVAAFEHGIGG